MTNDVADSIFERVFGAFLLGTGMGWCPEVTPGVPTPAFQMARPATPRPAAGVLTAPNALQHFISSFAL